MKSENAKKWAKNFSNYPTCEHCGSVVDEVEDGLCSECHDELNHHYTDDIIGYEKGE